VGSNPTPATNKKGRGNYMPQKPAVKEVVRSSRVKKEKKPWTKESAQEFIKKNQTKGLRYWSAADYLKKAHGIDITI